MKTDSAFVCHIWKVSS